MSHSDYRFERFYKIWSFVNCLINLAGLVSVYISDLILFWVAGAFLSFLIYTRQLPTFLSGFPLLIGYANWISLFRLVIISLAMIYWDKMSDIILFGLFVGVIILDGVDGYISRRFNQISKQGEYLDMEIDALFVFLLSYMHFSHEKLPAWILIPGGLRYVYGILFTWAKQPSMIRPGKKFRSTVAVLFFISLLMPLITSKLIYMPVILISSSLIVLSFTISAFYLLVYQFTSDR